MKYITVFTILLISFLTLPWQCANQNKQQIKIRTPVDTVGYAHRAAQMDSIVKRIDRQFGKERNIIFRLNQITDKFSWHLVISPHDDYSYAGDVYPYAAEHLSTPTVIIFGVAHKAKNFDIEDKIVFDSFTHWMGPYGKITVSTMREDIIANMPQNYYSINDSLQAVEHSVEALLPFIQYYHRSVEIVSILVPYMDFHRMNEISDTLSSAIYKISRMKKLKWGGDYSFAISNDCVHYGDEGWGGKNYAIYGADSSGYRNAVNFDMNIINECLIDEVDPQRIKRFMDYTLRHDDYKEYAWTWCGRYSVPFGLLTGYSLKEQLGKKGLTGKMMRYSTSVMHEPIRVSDLGLGQTAPANIRHWVGYVAIGYRLR